MKKSGENFVLGVYNNEDVLIKAVNYIKSKDVAIYEVFTPYPVHGLDHVLGYRRSKLPVVAFSFGFLGFCCALLMQSYMLGIDWPMNIGGKDFIPLPAFVPITFEMTVLFCSFGMVGTFLVISDLNPLAKPRIFDVRITDDKLVLVIDLSKNSLSENSIAAILKDSGASEVNNKYFS